LPRTLHAHLISLFYNLPSLQYHPAHHHLHSFPTRRSSDLPTANGTQVEAQGREINATLAMRNNAPWLANIKYLYYNPSVALISRDRKSTRLNSSHVSISYAVFCLKKKTHSTYTHIQICHYS